MQKGFTLIQLAIVFVIIGLLIGGILAGRSMIETAKIQRLMSDLEQYEAAAALFRKTYRYWPGDNPNFTPAGNGNHMIETAPLGGGCLSEQYQFFLHLSQAEMLDKTYTGCTGNINTSGPYTEIPKQSLISTKKLIIANWTTNRYMQTGLDFRTEPYFAGPMQAKLGTSLFPSCWNAGGSVACTAPDASYAWMIWTFRR